MRLSVGKDEIRIVLFEGIHDKAVESLESRGYTSVVRYEAAPDPRELPKLIAEAHVVGIRSRTQLTEDVLAAAERLFCIGCFCIGTNQVDVRAAKRRGIPVFNAPYSNTRSVAELVVGEIIMLMRRVPEKASLARDGVWRKSVSGAREIRGRTLGIVGYGHIGSQLSILAEALGMKVIYHDIVDTLAIGNAEPCPSLKDLLERSEVVSLHVPGTPDTKNLIGAEQLACMRPGAILVNAARGDVVDVEALAEAIASGHLAGAAVDVFPEEPSGPDEALETPLQGLSNVLLTPHIGGSTNEAQVNIGAEVADKVVRYSDTGSTIGAVNFVEVSLPVQRNATRFLHIHENHPGVLRAINDVFAARQLNIAGQYLRTDADVGYVVTDIDGALESGDGIRRDLRGIPGTIRSRFLY